MKLLRTIECGLALVTVLGGTVAKVLAQGAPPVAITDCEVLQYIPVHAHPFWRPFGPYPVGSVYTDGVQIKYVNHGPLTATRVAFRVDYRGDVQRIIDVGTFSPGAPITHTFGQLTGDAWLGPKPNACRVVAVRFTDGTVWHAGRL
jgi:hypothetical protein